VRLADGLGREDGLGALAALSTVNMTGADFRQFPASSAAAARILWTPLVTDALSQDCVHGAPSVSDATSRPSTYHLTSVTPRVADAVAASATTPVTVDLLIGYVMETLGAPLSLS
jgi:hypothetical protein